MKMKELIQDKVILWSIRLILISVAGILLLFLFLKSIQAYHTAILINQMAVATEEYIDNELSSFNN